MRVYETALENSLAAAQDYGIAPVYFVSIAARDRTTHAQLTVGFWTGDEDITLEVEDAEKGGTTSATFYGGAGLTVDGLMYTADLTDNAVSIGLSSLMPTVENMVRGYTVRFAPCTVYGTTMNGGALTSSPQVLSIGVIDAVSLGTPEIEGEGRVTLSSRSELLGQLMIRNSAKSSDNHQKRRSSGDRFSRYGGVLSTWRVQWFKD